MNIEVITTMIGQPDPERMPSLQGFGPIAGPPRPLADPAGRPLLPRIVRALRNGVTLPSPASEIERRSRSVLDAGATYPAVDPELLAAAQERARHLRAQVSGDLLLAAFNGVGRVFAATFAALGGALVRGLAAAFRHTTSTFPTPKLGPYGRPGALDVPPDYEERRARFSGRGL
jgi:hypothetical protein